MVAFTGPSRDERRACASRRAGSASCAGRSNPTTRSHRNQQYSVTALTDATGGIVERYAYTAYGQPTFLDGSGTVLTASAEDNRYTCTGREWDATLDLYHYRARIYDATEGRFCSRDPIGVTGRYASLYEHVGGLPTSRVDPFGLQYDNPEMPEDPGEQIPREDLGRLVNAVDAIANGMFFSNGLGSNCYWLQISYNTASINATYVSGGFWCFESIAELAGASAVGGALRPLFPRTYGKNGCPECMSCANWSCTRSVVTVPIPPVNIASTGCTFNLSGSVSFSVKSCTGSCEHGGGDTPSDIYDEDFDMDIDIGTCCN